jgi:chromosome segregation ATPase
MNQEIKFTCSNCGQKMLVDASAIGLTVHCPTCAKELIVPATSTVAVSPPSSIRSHSEIVTGDSPEPAGVTMAGAIVGTSAPDPRQELIAATVQISRLEGQIEEFRQQVKKLRSEQSRVSAERDEALSQIQQLRSEQSHATAEHDGALSQIQQLEGQIEEFRQQVKKLRSEQSRVSAERDEALSQIQQMAPELDVAREHIRGYEQAVDSLQQQVRQAESDVTDARQQLADTQEERMVGLREIQALEQRVAAQHQELTSLQADHTAATGRIAALETDLAKVRETLISTERANESSRAEIGDLLKERDSLRRSVSESGLGQELVAVRAQLAAAEKECKGLSLHARQLTSDVDAAEKARKERDDLIRTLKAELENARSSAVANSEAKNNHDNEVLRGIIARQNSELEQKHAQLKRLKRARLGVQLAYALFAAALAGIFILAMKIVPNLNPSKFLNP